jgi:putative glutamine amidotransferase
MNAPKKPVVALSMRIAKAPNYPEPRDAISQEWTTLLEYWAMTPLFIPNLINDVPAYMDTFKPDALVLTGGDDIGATPDRDKTEMAMLDHALNTDLPVFGVCRGLQMINTYLGGALINLEGHINSRHKITLAPSWQKTYGDAPEVNSYHGLGIETDGLANDLIATATDADGHIEAFCHQEKPLAAVMWHPERGAALEGDRHVLSNIIKTGAFWT